MSVNSKATVVLRGSVTVEAEGYCFEDMSVGISCAVENERILSATPSALTPDEFAATLTDAEWDEVAEALATAWHETRWGE